MILFTPALASMRTAFLLEGILTASTAKKMIAVVLSLLAGGTAAARPFLD